MEQSNKIWVLFQTNIYKRLYIEVDKNLTLGEVKVLLQEVFNIPEAINYNTNDPGKFESVKVGDYLAQCEKQDNFNGMIPINITRAVEDPQKKAFASVDFTPTRPQKTPDYSTFLTHGIAPTIFLKN